MKGQETGCLEAHLHEVVESQDGNRDILRLVVVKKSDGAFAGVLPSETGDFYAFLDEKDKIQAEIDRWLAALSRGEPLEDLSQGLYDMYVAGGKEALARSLRMLLYLKALLVSLWHPEDKPADLAERLELPEELLTEADTILNGCEELKNALNTLSTYRIPLTDRDDVCVSLGLLLVQALVLSQIEFFRPVFWEAYSAARAREELTSRLPKACARFIDLVTLFIRYQSAPGQYARFTGDDKFMRKIIVIAGRLGGVSGNPNIVATLQKTIQILGVVHEARNHRLPGTDRDYEYNEFKLNVDVTRPWKEATCFLVCRNDVSRYSLADLAGIPYRNVEHLKQALGSIPSQLPISDIVENSKLTGVRLAKAIFKARAVFAGKARSTHTWGFTTSFNIEPEKLKIFKDRVEDISSPFLRSSAYESVSFTFGRDQAKDLRDKIPDYIAEVRDLDGFNTHFQTKSIEVPNCFGAGKPELVVEIRLKDEIAAKLLLFDERHAPIPPPLSSDNHNQKDACATLRQETAAWLFCRLCQIARDKFRLAELALHKDQKCYFPFPLMSRLLQVVYRLRPETCACLPITFQQEQNTVTQEIIYLPRDLCPQCQAEEISLICNYVHALILNQGVSRGFLHCFIGLGELKGDKWCAIKCSEGHGGMSPEAWAEEIDKVYWDNYYAVLEEKYLRDYYSAQNNVQQLPFLRPSPLTPPGIAATSAEFQQFFGLATPKQYFLGIDIGGTNIKVHFYRFVPESPPEQSSFAREKKSFLFSTALTPNNKFTSQQNFHCWLERLIDNVIDVIKNGGILENSSTSEQIKLLGVGISWPGPVRQNCVAGTSGILKYFHPLTGMIVNNQIQDIINLNITAQFKKIWREKCVLNKLQSFAEINTVTLINDGDADGIGAVDYFKKSGDEKMVVIKVGTGTAGAFFTGGRLEPGLNEWGKILLDLNAPMAKAVQRDFPQGVANAYLSQGTMGNLIKVNDGCQDFFQAEKIDPKELDLILSLALEWEASKDFATFTRGLRTECGLRALVSQPNFDIDVELLRWSREQLRAVASSAPAGETPLRKYYRGDVTTIEKRLERDIEQLGAWRLACLLNLPQDPSEKLQGEQLGRAGEIIATLAEKFGNFLGDLIALLYDRYQMTDVVLGGGILSGKIGEMAIDAARKRVQQYGIRDLRMGRPSPPAASDPGNGRMSLNLGTLGAAIQAATSYLMACKEQGLMKLEENLMRLRTNDTVILELDPDRVSFGSRFSSLELSKYALTPNDVSAYFDRYAAELGYYRSGQNPLTYTRWSMDVSRRRR